MRNNRLPWRAGLALTAIAGLAACSNSDKNTPSLGDTVAVTSDNRIVSFDLDVRGVRTAVAISGLQASEQIVGIDIRPASGSTQTLYALSSAGRLYTVDAASGMATLVAALSPDPADASDAFTALAGTSFGIDFNPVVDRLRVISDTGQNLRINVDNGRVTTDTALTVAGAALTGSSATAYSNAFGAACRTTHFFIDTSADRLLSAVSSNDGTLSAIGALGVDVSAINGFDVLTAADGSNTLVAALTAGSSVALYTINASTGAATQAGPITGLNSSETLRGIAVATLATAPTQAPGDLLGLTANDQLVSFNAASPQKLCTSGLALTPPAGETLQGFDLRPETGELIALTSNATSGKLYTVNTTTGALTLKSTLDAALSGTSFGLDFNPAVDRLRVVSDSGQNLRINVDTGATTVDGALNGAATAATAAAYTNSVGGLSAAAPGVFTTALLVIDPVTDTLYTQTPPNNGTLVTVGPLGINVDAVAAFDINARTGAAVAALSIAGVSTASDLYTLNLTTGVATRVNTIGGGQPLKGLSYRVNAKADLLALTTDNRLTLVPAGTPATAATPVAIAGVGAGETLLGLDYRPATGQVVALSDADKLYTLTFNGTAATATLLSTLTGATVAGTALGLDFNPVPDRLRVVSDVEENLRINVATGAVTVDGTLAPASTVFGAAYTQNFSGTASTTLFYLDAGTDTLLTTSNPNGGITSSVGALGVDVGGEGDFDILGGQDGIVFAALNPNATSSSTLYRVSLSTGALTPVGIIGDGSYRVRGLTVRVQ